MDYSTWRISFQSSEQAACSAFNELLLMKGLLAQARSDLREAKKQRDVLRATVIVAAELAPARGMLSGLLNAAMEDMAMNGANT